MFARSQLLIRTAAAAGRGGRRLAFPAARTHPSVKASTVISGVRAAAQTAQSLPVDGVGRSHYHVAAAEDPVKDYRELAKMDIWEGLFQGAQGSKTRVLDTCAGTGRWAQAFSELVVGNREVTCDFADLCSDSLATLGERRQGMQNLGSGEFFAGDLCELGKLGAPSQAYDIIVNMHGLYGIPTAKLPSALQAMHNALKPGGTMVLAIGSETSPYQKVPTECLGATFTSDADIVQALDGLGIQSSTKHITYEEEFARENQDEMMTFLMDECGGNTFPTDVAQDMAKPEASIQSYADAHFDQTLDAYRFPQQASVITVHRDNGLAEA